MRPNHLELGIYPPTTAMLSSHSIATARAPAVRSSPSSSRGMTVTDTYSHGGGIVVVVVVMLVVVVVVVLVVVLVVVVLDGRIVVVVVD